MKKYTEKEMKRIMKQDVTMPDEVEEKVKNAYGMLGMESRKTVRRSYKKLVLVAAAMTMLAATSVVALAANGFFTKEVVEEDQNLTYQFEANYELTPYEVKATPGYIPEGYTEYEEGKYDSDGLHKNGISIIGVNASWLAAEQSMLNVENVENLEKTTLDGMEAHVITLKTDEERSQYSFDKRIYLFNPEEGYVVVIYGGNDISIEELKKVADQIDVEVDQSSPLDYKPESEIVKEDAQMDEWEQQQKEDREAGVAKEQIFKIGETFKTSEEDPNAADVTIVSAKVQDSLDGYATDNFFNYEENMSYWVNEDGSLKPYERITRPLDSTEESGREEIGQKILEVKCKAVNTSDETIDFWAGAGLLTNLIPNEDGSAKYPDTVTEPVDLDHGMIQTEKYPVYFDQPQHTGEDRNHFYFRDLQPGETFEYTLLYVVDEDMINNMYLNFNTSTDYKENLFVDLNQ